MGLGAQPLRSFGAFMRWICLASLLDYEGKIVEEILHRRISTKSQIHHYPKQPKTMRRCGTKTLTARSMGLRRSCTVCHGNFIDDRAVHRVLI